MAGLLGFLQKPWQDIQGAVSHLLPQQPQQPPPNQAPARPAAPVQPQHQNIIQQALHFVAPAIQPIIQPAESLYNGASAALNGAVKNVQASIAQPAKPPTSSPNLLDQAVKNVQQVAHQMAAPGNIVAAPVKAAAPTVSKVLTAAGKLDASKSNPINGVPVLGDINKSMVAPGLTSMGVTAANVGKIAAGQNPYKGMSQPQATGALMTDVLNASLLVPGVGDAGAVVDAAKAPAENASKTIIQQFLPKVVEGAKGGAKYGGAYGAANSLQQKGATPGSVASATAQGALGGTLFGAATPLAEGGARGAVKAGANVAKAASNAGSSLLDDAVKGVQQANHVVADQAGHTQLPGPSVKVEPPKPSNQSVKVATKPTATENVAPAKPSAPAAATPPPNLPKLDVQTFLDRTAKAPEFAPGNTNLETNLQKLQGTHTANQIALKSILKGHGFKEPDLTAAFHYAEDKSQPVTPVQKGIYTHYVLPTLKATHQVSDMKTPFDTNHIPRFAQNKGSKYEEYVTGNRSNVDESAMRKTTNQQKSRTHMAIVDNKTGERHVVSLVSPKDATGKVTGAKQVLIHKADGTTVKAGVLKKNLPTPVKEFIDPHLDSKLNSIAHDLGISHKRVVTLPGRKAGDSLVGGKSIRTRAASAPDVILHEIGHQIDDKYGMQQHMFGASKPKSDMILKNQIAKLERESKLHPAKEVTDTMARERADMLRSAHKETGGTYLHRDDSGYGRATTKRVSTNDPFYRKFYASHGKAPTRADWVAEAHRQLKNETSDEGTVYRDALKAGSSKNYVNKETAAQIDKMKQQLTMNGEMRKLADARTPGREKPWAYARKGEEKMAVMFQAHLHAPDIFQKEAPVTYKAFKDFLNSHEDTKAIADIGSAKSLAMQSRVIGEKQMPGEFIDKAGKHWSLRDATAKEIEAVTNTRYFKNPVSTSAVAHVNAVNAKAANAFLDTWQKSPDFKDHAIKDGTGTPPDGWQKAKSPFFKAYTFDPKTAQTIDRLVGGGGSSEPTSAVGHAWDAINNVAIQTMVLNPTIHGANLLEQAHIAAGNIPGFKVTGMGAFERSLASTLSSSKRGAMLDNYLRAGGHFETYGSDRVTLVSKALQASHLPGVNKLNSGAMAGIDATIRSALFDASTRHGMDPQAAVKNIDTFLGSKTAVDKTAQNILVFGHYFIHTLGGSIKAQVTHPIKNAGAIANTAITMAALYGINKAWQSYTGNNAAHVRTPGELGLLNDLYNTPGQLASGQVPSFASAHIAPAINALSNQLAGQDSFTGAPVKTLPQRGENLLSTLVSPYQQVSKVANGKQSPLEAIANENGLYTPHVKGTQAAPNLGANSPLNTKGATPDTNKAYTGQQAYYKAVDAGKLSLAGDQHTLDQFNAYFSRTHNDKGQSIQPSPAQRIATAKELIGNPALLAAVQKAEASQPNSDPMWSLPKDKLQAFLDYQSSLTGDPSRTAMKDQNTWLPAFIKTRDNYYSQQTFSGNSVPAPGTPAYPSFNAQTTSDLAAYDNNAKSWTSAQKGAFLDAHPNVTQAFGTLDTYTNKMRVAEGGLALKTSPTASPELQSFMKEYNSGSKADRTAIRNSNPQQYQNMIAFYDSTDLSTINKQGAVNQFVGEPDQTSAQNKAIQGLAKDIYQNSSGTYQIVPAGWMNGLTNSSSGFGFGSGSSTKTPSASYHFKDTTALSKLIRSTSFKPGGIKGFKISNKMPKVPKVASTKMPKIKTVAAPKVKMLRMSKKGKITA